MAERLEHAVDPGPGPDEISAPDPDRAAGDDFSPLRELSLLVPERLARAVQSRRAAWTPIDTVAGWLIAAHLVLLLVIVGRGSLYVDDLRAQGYAVQQPFWQFIVGSNGTHFAPVPRVLDWVQSRVFPLEHSPATTVTLLVRLLLALGFWRVLRRLFGARPATLTPLAVLLFTPALIPATTWYRQSITVLACTVAMVWAIDSQLRWVLYRRRSDLAVLVVITAVGLGCYEKAAAIPVILLGVSLALFAGRGPGARSNLVAALKSVLASAVVVLVFVFIYRSGPYDQGAGSPPSALDMLRLGWNTGTRTMIPLLLGGPYHWAFPTRYSGVTALSTTAVVFSLVIVLLVVAVALRRGPARTGRALIVLIAWSVPSVAIVAAGRFAQYGMTLVDAARLWADLVPAFLLVAALALLPWRVGVASVTAPRHRDTPEPTEPITPTGSITPAEPSIPTARRPGGAAAPVAITMPALATVLVILVVLGGSVFSSLTYATRWWQNPTGQWIANARASLVNAEPYPRTLATPLPASIMPTWVSFAFPTDAPLLLLLRPDTRFYDGDGATRVMNAAGVRSSYFSTVLTQTKKAKLCVATFPAGSSTPVTIPFPKTALYASGSQLEVGLLLAESTKVEVSALTPEGKVLQPQRFSDDVLLPGPHTLRLPVPYGQAISAVRVQITGSKISCVAYARVWVPFT